MSGDRTEAVKRVSPPGFFYRHGFSLIVYALYLIVELYVLISARDWGLLGIPRRDMDQWTFLAAAARMLAGGSYPDDCMLSPAYVWFLYFLGFLTNGDLFASQVLQAIVCAFIPVMIFRFSLRAGLGRTAAKVGALLYCFYGPGVLLSVSFLREAPLSLCFLIYAWAVAAAYATTRVRYVVIAGAFAALCVMGRENFLPIAIAPLFLPALDKAARRRFSWRQAALFLGVMALTLAPLLTRNYLRSGAFSVIPGNFRNVLGSFHGGKEKVGFNADFIGELLANAPGQAAAFVSSYEVPNNISYYAHRDVLVFLRVLFAPFNLLVGLALAGLVLRWKWLGVRYAAFLIVLYAGSILWFQMFFRFRIPVAPLIAALAGVGVVALARKRSPLKWVTAVFLAAFLVATWVNPRTKQPAGERRAAATLLIDYGAFESAERYLKTLKEDKVSCADLEIRLARQRAAIVNEETKTGR